VNIGWIGIGRIGIQMVLRLLKLGHHVKAHSRHPQDHGVVEKEGGVLVRTLAEAVSGVDRHQRLYRRSASGRPGRRAGRSSADSDANAGRHPQHDQPEPRARSGGAPA